MIGSDEVGEEQTKREIQSDYASFAKCYSNPAVHARICALERAYLMSLVLQRQASRRPEAVMRECDRISRYLP